MARHAPSQPLGCLSLSALISMAIVILVVGGVTLARGGVLFSPGALNAQATDALLGEVRSHAEIADCGTCHVTPFSTQQIADRCLACHTDLVDDPHNFHKVMIAEGLSQGCRKCHTEHHGPQAALTHMELLKFPHYRLGGYTLVAHQVNGDGSSFKCSDCHPKGYSGFDQVVCIECHTKLKPESMTAHMIAFGLDCRACHDGLDSYGSSFTHPQTPFSLTGPHANLECGQCHSGARSIAEMQATSDQCISCHKPLEWNQVKTDHSKTAFPLEGAHQSAACTDCHAKNIYKGTPVECFACHIKNDKHKGSAGLACGNCHTAVKWK